MIRTGKIKSAAHVRLRWPLINYLAGACFAGLAVLTARTYSPYLIILVAPIVVVLYLVVKNHFRLVEVTAERARAEAAREAALESAKLRSEFLANMSHEIRTPLNAVIGLSGLMLEGELTPEQRESAATIRASSESLLAIINDILDFSKMEAGKYDLERHPFRLGDCVEEALDLFAHAAAKKSIELGYRVEPGTPEALVGDPTRLRQILVNLIGNAIKFTDAGEVEVTVGAVSVSEAGCELRFTVRDTGIGISPEGARKLFQAFSQTDGSSARRYGGTGLGLAICKRLCEMMGGRIWVESAPGVGSRFHFTLRLAPGADATVAGRGREQPAHASKRPLAEEFPLRILLAEDNAINQKVALSLLSHMGYRVDLAANGLEVLSALERQSYDIVLMDVQMPEMDGLEATRRVRGTLGVGRAPRIIALTACAMQEDREKCFAAGMDDYLVKPITYEALRGALAQAGREAFAGRASEAEPDGEPSPTLSDGLVTLDAAHLASWRDLQVEGGQDVINELMELFFAETPAHLAGLRRALAEADFKEAQRLAHLLRGSAASIGARRMSSLCAVIEETCGRGEAPDSALADRLGAELTDVVREAARLSFSHGTDLSGVNHRA